MPAVRLATVGKALSPIGQLLAEDLGDVLRGGDQLVLPAPDQEPARHQIHAQRQHQRCGGEEQRVGARQAGGKPTSLPAATA